MLLDLAAREIDADGIKARAACLAVKVTDLKNFSINLPAGGEASFSGQRIRSEGPAEINVRDGKAEEVSGKDLEIFRRLGSR